MGDEATFTPEEKVILGEIEPEPQAADQVTAPEGGEPPKEEPKAEAPKEPEHTEEENKAAEQEGFRIEGKFLIDTEGTKIPLEKWRKTFYLRKDAERGKEETERKFKLFQELGADKYYELYPGEAPEGYRKPEPKRQWPQAQANLGEMIVRGGQYDGQTLNQVWQQDPAYANFLQNQHLESIRSQQDTEKSQREALVKESTTEVEQFSVSIAKELFGKDDLSKLSKDEEYKIGQTIQSTFDWMRKTGRGGGFLADAYFLMNKENIINDVKVKAGKAALDSITKPSVPSIAAAGGGAVGGSAYETMSREELAVKIEGMSEAQFAKFKKDASSELKAKHPDLPWD